MAGECSGDLTARSCFSQHSYLSSKIKDVVTSGSLAYKRIIFLLANFLLGGAERQALVLGRQLAEQERADVRVWALGETGPAVRIAEEFGLPHRCLGLRWPDTKFGRAWLLVRLTARLRMARPDAILSYLVVPNTVVGTVWRLTGADVSVWNQRDAGLARIGGRIERWAVHNTPLFVSNSSVGAQFLTDTLCASRERVHVIRNGVTVEQPRLTRDENRSKFGLASRTFAACMLANITELKDHVTLLKAWRVVVDRRNTDPADTRLLLAGAFGSTYGQVTELVRDLGLHNCVHFLGLVEEVWDLLSAVDLYVHCAHAEGCPNGVLEAMGSGLAVAGTDVPGIREALGPDGYDFLSLPGDVDGLAHNILRLIADPGLCAQLGQINRLRIAAEFRVARLGSETAQLLRMHFLRR